ncbi:MAG: alkaline phosphatase family protein [Chlorobiota bacterium]
MLRLLLCVVVAAILAGTRGLGAGPTPRLVVVLVFDQMRGDYLWRWQPLWSSGFKRLLSEGFWYRNCLIQHGATVTCAGHATLATGAPPSQHGISGNALVTDCCPRRLVGCAADTSGLPSTMWLRLPTLGDALRQQFPQAKVISLSHKARAALMMGGHSPTAVLWLDPEQDGLVTYPTQAPPAWLSEWNRRHSAWQYAGRVWEPLLPASFAPIDSVPWEARFPEGSSAFPHRLPDTTKAFWDAFLLSPFSVAWLMDAARTAIHSEALGRDSIPDILWVSISTTDIVGHYFGPDSRELLELYLSCDQILGEFLQFLDDSIGRSHYVVVVTSDHGVAPVPEMLLQAGPGAYPGIDAGRISTEELALFLHRRLIASFGSQAGLHWFVLEPPIMLLNRELIRQSQHEPEVVLDSLVRWLREYEGIGIVLQASELQQPPADRVTDTLHTLLPRSFPPTNAGDILLYPRPFWIFGTDVPATHGTPYEYDRFIPLVFFGAGIPRGSSTEPATPEDVAPTLAALLRIPLPTATGRALPHVLGSPAAH